MKKAISILLTMGLCAGLLAGCGAKSAATSEEATTENPMVLTLSHGLSETHTVHIAMEEFAEKVEERTDGRIKVEIFPNAQLGSETESMEQLTAGVIAMTKVAAPILATYEEGYNAFGLPYIFDDTEDFYHVMDSDEMHEFFLSTEDEGFVTLTYYTSGARSFYTKDKAIRTPEDLKGLKIRVQDMESQTDMLDVMGGTPVAMSYGDVYTSLQTGIIDGTENNETALTTGKHGEICKVYSKDEHAMIPDVMVMSAKYGRRLVGRPADHPGGGTGIDRQPQSIVGRGDQRRGRGSQERDGCRIRRGCGQGCIPRSNAGNGRRVLRPLSGCCRGS